MGQRGATAEACDDVKLNEEGQWVFQGGRAMWLGAGRDVAVHGAEAPAEGREAGKGQRVVDASPITSIAEPVDEAEIDLCLLYTSPSPRDGLLSRMPSSA